MMTTLAIFVGVFLLPFFVYLIGYCWAYGTKRGEHRAIEQNLINMVKQEIKKEKMNDEEKKSESV